MKRRSDGSLHRSTCKKLTYSGQYTNFHNWFPPSRNRKLINYLSSWINRICSNNTIDGEPFQLWQILIRFLNRNITSRQHPKKSTNSSKENSFLWASNIEEIRLPKSWVNGFENPWIKSSIQLSYVLSSQVSPPFKYMFIG